MQYNKGVLAANLVSFDDNGGLDTKDLIQRIHRLNAYSGVTGYVANAYAGEGPTLTNKERETVIALHKEHGRPEQIVVAAILDISTAGAVAQAKAAASVGADALLICPPIASSWTAAASPDIAIAYHKAISDGVDLPVFLFQLAVGDPTSYPHDLLMQLVETIPNVVGVKMAQANDTVRYDQDYLALTAHNRDIICLPAVGTAMFANLMTGADGLLTGLACLFPEEVVGLYDAVERGDVATARAIHFRLAQINFAIYRQPYVDLHTRYKELAFALGAVSSPVVRGPQVRVSAQEQAQLRKLLNDAQFTAHAAE